MTSYKVYGNVDGNHFAVVLFAYNEESIRTLFAALYPQAEYGWWEFIAL